MNETTEVDPVREASDAVRFGYTIDPYVREELAMWLSKKGTTDPFAQRIVHYMNLVKM